jgi:hypothetical protein
MKPYKWNIESIQKSPFMKGQDNPQDALALAKEKERAYYAGESIGFTYVSSLKSMGRIPRSDGTYKKGDKYLN